MTMPPHMPVPSVNRVAAPGGVQWQGTRNAFDLVRSLPGLMLGTMMLMTGGSDLTMVSAVICLSMVPVGPWLVWFYAQRRISIEPDRLMLFGPPGKRAIPWTEIVHLSLKVKGQGQLGESILTMQTRLGTVETHKMRYVEAEMFRYLGRDLAVPLRRHNVPFEVLGSEAVRIEAHQTALDAVVPPPRPPVPPPHQ